MKRRTFVQTGVASALGLAVHPGVLSSLHPVKDDIQAWLGMFQENIQARLYRASRVLSDNDLQAVKKLDTYFAQRFFHRESNSVYTLTHQAVSYFFYPVFLQNASAGVRDILVPIFMQLQDHSWKHIGTYTGFQLEAIAQASNALQEMGINVSDLLLPVANGKTDGSALLYKSLNGSVSISTIVKNRAQTTLRVFQADHMLLDLSFVSKHCLHALGV